MMFHLKIFNSKVILSYDVSPKSTYKVVPTLMSSSPLLAELSDTPRASKTRKTHIRYVARKKSPPPRKRDFVFQVYRKF